MSSDAASHRDVLLEIGCEELPSSFVDAALVALPELAKKKLEAARIGFGGARSLGSPRRLALIITGIAPSQTDLDEEVMGPPVKAAFKDGVPTRAAEAFAQKLGIEVSALRRVDTPKGEYVTATRAEKGQPTRALLPSLLESIVREIPFRKSMRWADIDFAFGRPIQWLVALDGEDVIELDIATKKSGRASLGHRFLSTGPISIDRPSSYVETLRKAHVLVDPAERREALARGLAETAKSAGGSLIEDAFLMDENTSLVEEPHVVAGSFDPAYLSLPERVILEVAKGHQRYFGIRGADGKLLPRYLAVLNTALEPGIIVKGNDSVMRARLADAQFFYNEDVRTPLGKRREKLAGVVFQKRLGSVLEKSDRVERLTVELGRALGLGADVVETARRGAHLAKCDLVSLMVGELPELQGDMGASYARAQGEPAEVADVIREHYRPKGAHDDTAGTDAAALVAIADRLDTVVACFGIGLAPTGTADPFGLRRAVLGILRTMLDRGFDLSLSDMIRLAEAQLSAVKLDLKSADLTAKLLDFMGDRLRGVLIDKHPHDAVRAALGAGFDRPIDARKRIVALAALPAELRSRVGEVFKRATNIAGQAPAGDPTPPAADAHKSEAALFEVYRGFASRAVDLAKTGDYGALLAEIGTIAPVMHQYFVDVLVMCEDVAVRENRLRLMRAISERCARVARLELLAAT